MKIKVRRGRGPFPRLPAVILLVSSITLLPGCSGRWGHLLFSSSSPSSADKSASTLSSQASALRRLSRDELDNSVRDIFGESQTFAQQNLADDPANPFDNDVSLQLSSGPLIEGLENFAKNVSTSLLADATRRDGVIGCKPASSQDAACLGGVVKSVGRRLFRRPLSADELARFTALGQSYAAKDSDFYSGVDAVLRTMLQHPAFVFRSELGRPVGTVPGSYRLSDFEIASRLSFFLWGTSPDDALLDKATAGGLSSPSGRQAAALVMLGDPRAVARFNRFHALWLGYSRLSHPEPLKSAMLDEISAVIDKTIFTDNSSWFNLLTTNQTYIDSTMAQIYGLTLTGSGRQWITLPSDRLGILSLGAFLSVAAKFGDTSPTQRGKLVRERLMCQTIPPPPPNVNVDQAPQAPDNSPCKWNRYAAHRNSQQSCLGCHSQMDPIGFGLENYDQKGQYRTMDLVNGTPNAGCVIKGEGELAGVGNFKGPAQLGALLVQSGQIQKCLVRQVYRFAMGRQPELDGDAAFLSKMESAFQQKGNRFKDLLLDFISTDEFTLRQGGAANP